MKSGRKTGGVSASFLKTSYSSHVANSLLLHQHVTYAGRRGRSGDSTSVSPETTGDWPMDRRNWAELKNPDSDRHSTYLQQQHGSCRSSDSSS